MSLNMDNHDFKIVDGVLKEYKGDGGDTVVIPDGVTRIASFSFTYLGPEMDKLIIPDSVTVIEELSLPQEVNDYIRFPRFLESIGEQNLPYGKIQFYNSIKANIGDIGRPSFFSETITEILSTEDDSVLCSFYLLCDKSSDIWSGILNSDFEKYDEALLSYKPGHVMTEIMYRLLNPYGLSESAKKSYLSSLHRIAKKVIASYIEDDDFTTIEFLIKEKVIDAKNIDYAINYANENGASLSMRTRLIKAKKDYFGDGITVKKTEKAVVKGSVIEFGVSPITKKPLRWIVVEAQKKKWCLVCAEYVANMPFVKPGVYDRYASLYWDKSYFREWLNGEFYETCFSEQEKSRILETAVNSRCSGYTVDRIYIMKEPDFNKYFRDSDGNLLKRIVDCGQPDVFRDANGYRELPGVIIKNGDYRRSVYKFYQNKQTADFPVRPIMWITAE